MLFNRVHADQSLPKTILILGGMHSRLAFPDRISCRRLHLDHRCCQPYCYPCSQYPPTFQSRILSISHCIWEFTLLNLFINHLAYSLQPPSNPPTVLLLSRKTMTKVKLHNAKHGSWSYWLQFHSQAVLFSVGSVESQLENIPGLHFFASTWLVIWCRRWRHPRLT